MAATPGICTQSTKCQTARSGRVIVIGLGEPFACPDCGSPLTPPAQAATMPPPKPAIPLALAMGTLGAGLFVLGGAMFLGRQLGSTPAPVAQIAPPLAVLASSAPPVAKTAIPQGSAPAQASVPSQGHAPSDAQMAPAPNVLAAAAPVKPPVALAALAPSGQPMAPQPLPDPVAMPDVASLTPAPASTPAPLPAPAIAASSPAPAADAPLPTQEAAEISVPDKPFSPVPEAGGAPAYPAELAAEGKPGRVGVTCQIQADGTPSGCKAVARNGGSAFATATLAWLTHGRVRYRPVTLHGKPVAATRSWTISIDEPATALAEARRKKLEEIAANPAPVAPQAVAPLAAARTVSVQPVLARIPMPSAARPGVAGAGVGPSRPFSTRVVAGGAPRFPAYYDEARPGAVSVSCAIETDGTPSGCQVLHSAGGKAFGGAVQAWLGSGHVRFAPIVENGTPVSRRETWTVVFNHIPEE